MSTMHGNDPLKDLQKEINNNSTDHTYEFDPQDIRRNNALSAVCYIPILFILPLILRPDSRYARFHANQGLLLLIISFLLGLIQGLISFIPLVSLLVELVFGVVVFGYFLYGFVNTLNGKARELPFIGGLTLIKY